MDQQIQSNGDASESGVFCEALTLGGIAGGVALAAFGGKKAWKGVKGLAHEGGREAAKDVLKGAGKKVKDVGSTVGSAGKNAGNAARDVFMDTRVGKNIHNANFEKKFKRSEDILKRGGRPNIIYAGSTAPHSDPVKL